MIKKQFTSNARRARNIIWNAAGDYDFEPPFMAFFPNGAPDHYFNMIIGLVRKWLDIDRIGKFFDSYAADRRSDEFDEYLWLGLENCVYEKESAERPVMERLRKQRAEQFYVEQAGMSRQQMEYQSMPVYTQQQARWASVSGRNLPVMTSREKRMQEALCLSGDMDTDQLLREMADFLKTFFRYEAPHGAALRVRRRGSRGPKGSGRRRKDHFLVRTGTGEGDHPKAVTLTHDGLGRFVPPTQEDEDYIRAVFGKSVLPESETEILNNDICTGADANCRVWVTQGEESDADYKDAADIIARRRRQRELNENFYADNRAAVRSAVKTLSAGMETVFESYLKHLPEASRAGRLAPEKVYRLPVLGDSKVFTRDGEETEKEVFVDILLDASQSRMNSQEIISAEALIAAKSFAALNVPVRVSAFRSLRGHTVLEILKDAGDNDCSGICGYYAGGWNRDSLAVRLIEHLDDDPHMTGKQRIVLIMTDANPNDSVPVAEAGHLLTREYDGAVAVSATEDAVRILRSKGIMVGAVFHGNSSHIGDLHQIYGHSCVRIRKPSQLAQGLCDLMLMLMSRR